MSVVTSAPTTAPGRRRNPWRGPREFRRDDRLPNREREARKVANLVIANRVVLLHAPSGAGKTSLVEAGVVKELEREGFRATPRLRVKLPSAEEGTNPYVASLIGYLFAGSPHAADAARMDLVDAVDLWETEQATDDTGLARTTVLIIDQLEEVLTCDPTGWPAQEEFFRQLGRLLGSRPVWALLSMREDYMGGLDRYLRYLPGHLRTRYRLDYLTPEDARRAIQVPSGQQHVDFGDDAAETLLHKLALVEVQQPGRGSDHREAPYVEPFQLQVVCRQLWKRLRRELGDDFLEITAEEVERYADVDQALAHYYGDTVAGVIRETGADERAVRDWFESELITKDALRSQTLRLPDTADAERVVTLLEAGYLIRGDVRGLSTWYELAHDRLIRPVLGSNETWRWAHLEPWQVAAHDWSSHGHNPAYLLAPGQLPGPLARTGDLTEVERAFLEASEEAARTRQDAADPSTAIRAQQDEVLRVLGRRMLRRGSGGGARGPDAVTRARDVAPPGRPG